MKIKHRSGNKSDWEKVAKKLIFMHVRGQKLPEMLEINLPPGTVLEVAREINLDMDPKDVKELEFKIENMYKWYEQVYKPKKVTTLPPANMRKLNLNF